MSRITKGSKTIFSATRNKQCFAQIGNLYNERCFLTFCVAFTAKADCFPSGPTQYQPVGWSYNGPYNYDWEYLSIFLGKFIYQCFSGFL